MKKSWEELIFWVAAIVAIVAIVFGSIYSVLTSKKAEFEENSNNANNPSIGYNITQPLPSHLQDSATV